MEGKSNFIMLVIIIALLTVLLAGMAVWLFVFQGKSSGSGSGSESAATAAPAVTVKYKAADLKTQKLIENTFMNLKPSTGAKSPIVQLSVSIKYPTNAAFKKANPKIVLTPEELVPTILDEFKDYCSSYFGKITFDEANNQEAAKEKAREELKTIFNEMVSKSEGVQAEVIESIVFEKWLVVNQ